MAYLKDDDSQVEQAKRKKMFDKMLANFEDADKDALGTLLVVLLVAVFLSVLTAVSLQVYGVVVSIRHALHCGQVLKTLPQQDPPPDTEAFYLVQIPVEESNMGSDW